MFSDKKNTTAKIIKFKTTTVPTSTILSSTESAMNLVLATETERIIFSQSTNIQINSTKNINNESVTESIIMIKSDILSDKDDKRTKKNEVKETSNYKKIRKKNRIKFVCCCMTRSIEEKFSKSRYKWFDRSHKNINKSEFLRYLWWKRYQSKCKNAKINSFSCSLKTNSIRGIYKMPSRRKIRHKKIESFKSRITKKQKVQVKANFRKFEQKCHIKWKKGRVFGESSFKRKNDLLHVAQALEPDFLIKA